ncbi:transcription factor [Pseudohyphozyma bogoriensis]|nr:transcription factor [Pseudohyphozyma bogoriensis]
MDIFGELSGVDSITASILIVLLNINASGGDNVGISVSSASRSTLLTGFSSIGTPTRWPAIILLSWKWRNVDEHGGHSSLLLLRLLVTLADKYHRTDEVTPLTVMLFRIRIAVLLRKIDDLVLGIKRVMYQTVLDLHDELLGLERMLPDPLQPQYSVDGKLLGFKPGLASEAAFTQFLLTTAVLRLHRPFLVLSGMDPRYHFSRQVVLKYAERLLVVALLPAHQRNWNLPTYTVITACIMLGLDLLQPPSLTQPTHPSPSRTRELILTAMKTFKSRASSSLLCAQGMSVVRFLLSKYEAAQRGENKRGRRVSSGGVLAEPSTSASALAGG